MTRPKRDSDKWRIIVDLSFPHGATVNDGIDNHNHLGSDITYSLPTITDLVTRRQDQGTAAYLWKADLTCAYRQLRADPLDTPLLGIKVGTDIYLNLCPPFVANHLPLYAKGWQTLLSTYLTYLDDYEGCDATLHEATRSYNTFRLVCKILGREQVLST